MNVLVEFLLVYLLYRFIAGFLVPLYRTTTTMRQQFRDANGRPPPGGPANPPNAGPEAKAQSTDPKSGSGKVGEYIDFEEVK